MPRESAAAKETVHNAMHRFKLGKLKSGRSNARVRSRAQAVAIGLSEAREKGQSVPKKRATRSARKRGRV